MRKRRHGFTLVELAIVISLLAIVTPLVYSGYVHVEERLTLARWSLETADAVTAISETLRADLRTHTVQDGSALTLAGACSIAYAINEANVFQRQADAACGGSLGLARGVESVARTPEGLEIVFMKRLRPRLTHRSTVLIPLEVR